MDFSSWMVYAMEVCYNISPAELLTLCWTIGNARNKVVWNQKHPQATNVVASSKHYLLQWISAQKFATKYLFPNQVEGDGVWVKPWIGSIKVTVDAAGFSEKSAFGIGMIARNHRGEVMKACTIFRQEVVSTKVVEVIGVKEALSWTK